MKKNENGITFSVILPGKAYSRDKQFNSFKYVKGITEYGIEYTLRYSLNLARDPCSAEASWKEDDCTLAIITGKMMDKHNCTVPWLLTYAIVNVQSSQVQWAKTTY